VQLGSITARCPLCGSADVIYTCAPHCCFNHVCGACRASWQLGTEATGRRLDALDEPPGEYDTAFPTAPCARCGGLAFQIADSEELACPECRALLRLECKDVKAFA
jgi:hypothetical protein